MSTKIGRFITFEGVDGSGKTTQMHLTAAFLRSQGYNILELREPGGTELGESIRTILLQASSTPITPVAELLLFAAARAQLCQQVIEPALAQGVIVLCDRFFDSTMAYQGFGRNIDCDVIQSLTQIATAGVQPHLTIWLDLACDEARKRLGDRGEMNRLDNESTLFMQQTRKGYEYCYARDPKRIIRLDASRSETTIQQETRELIGGILQ